MIKLIQLTIFFIFISSCSLNKNSKFWTKSKDIIQDENKIFKEVFPKEDSLKKEFNSGLNLNLTSRLNSSTSLNDNLNNYGRLDFDGDLKKSQYKFSKIDNFDQYQPEISFNKDEIIFLIIKVLF